MPLKEPMPLDYVGWVRRANACWIVHHDIGQTAESYLEHLGQNDWQRVMPSCRNAYLMVWLRDSMEDPKPWFYSGLFSLATESEAEKFLANHWLTRIAATSHRENPVPSSNVAGEMTLEKIRRIQETISKLPDRVNGFRSAMDFKSHVGFKEQFDVHQLFDGTASRKSC